MHSFALDSLAHKISYRFQDQALIERALTHRSVVGEPNNETLEFLGDAVLSLITAEELYRRWPNSREGMLSQIRSSFVCTDHLGSKAKLMGLAVHVKTAPDMRASGSIEVVSLLADTVEAIIAAAYIDGGLGAAKTVLHALLGEVPIEVEPQAKDVKTIIQERVQGICGTTPTYRVVASTGPSHAPVYHVEMLINDQAVQVGDGASKKLASQDAARKALELFNSISEEEIRDRFSKPIT